MSSPQRGGVLGGEGNFTITNAAGGATALCGDSRFVLNGAGSVFKDTSAGYTPNYRNFIWFLIGLNVMNAKPKISPLRTYFFLG